MNDLWIDWRWVAMGVCISKAAIFSGLNLSLFSLGKTQLEAEAQTGSRNAKRVLALRQDSNLLLSTILWGAVSANVLVAMLSDSLLAGMYAFLFSAIGLTLFGEILPQAYFSKYALRISSFFAPMIKVYRFLLWPVAMPCAKLLDLLVGKEGPKLMGEREMVSFLSKHIEESESEISQNEGKGAMNFLHLDDVKVSSAGNLIHQDTIMDASYSSSMKKSFLDRSQNWTGLFNRLRLQPRKRAIFLDNNGMPDLVLDTGEFLASLVTGCEKVAIQDFCHKPIVVTEEDVTLDDVLNKIIMVDRSKEPLGIDHDVIIFWHNKSPRIITLADITQLLMQGIVTLK